MNHSVNKTVSNLTIMVFKMHFVEESFQTISCQNEYLSFKCIETNTIEY